MRIGTLTLQSIRLRIRWFVFFDAKLEACREGLVKSSSSPTDRFLVLCLWLTAGLFAFAAVWLMEDFLSEWFLASNNAKQSELALLAKLIVAGCVSFGFVRGLYRFAGYGQEANKRTPPYVPPGPQK